MNKKNKFEFTNKKILYLPPKLDPAVNIKITNFNKQLRDEKTKKKIHKRV